MPGFSFYSGDFLPPKASAPFALSAEFPTYTSETIARGEGWQLNLYAYEGYLVKKLALAGYEIYIEGFISNREILNEALTRLLRGDMSVEAVKHFQETVFGDYLLWIIDNSGNRLIVMNDLLGRLPLYYCQREKGVLITRHLPEIVRYSGKNIHLPSLAAHIAFGYSPSEVLIWKGSWRFPESSFAVYDIRARQFSVERTTRMSFDQYTFKGSVDQAASELAGMFVEITRQQAEALSPAKPLISLSGGLDSRAVLGALLKGGVAFDAVTFLNHGEKNIEDLNIARQLAGRFGFNWKELKLPPASEADIRDLIQLKMGVIPVWRGDVMRFLKVLYDSCSSHINYITGDGGDKTLPDLTLQRKAPDIQTLIDRIMQNQAIMTWETLDNILPGNRLREHLEDAISNFPEESTDGKYIHFLIAGRAMHWMFEGEDRNRHFFPCSTPFYDGRFFRFAMAVPPAFKRNYRLYRLFLKHLNPALTEIPIAGWPDAIDSPIFKLRGYLNRLKSLMQGLAPEGLIDKFRKPFVPTGFPVERVETIKKAVSEMVDDEGNPVAQYIDRQGLQQCIHRMDYRQLNQLYGILKAHSTPAT